METDTKAFAAKQAAFVHVFISPLKGSTQNSGALASVFFARTSIFSTMANTLYSKDFTIKIHTRYVDRITTVGQGRFAMEWILLIQCKRQEEKR